MKARPASERRTPFKRAVGTGKRECFERLSVDQGFRIHPERTIMPEAKRTRQTAKSESFPSGNKLNADLACRLFRAEIHPVSSITPKKITKRKAAISPGWFFKIITRQTAA